MNSSYKKVKILLVAQTGLWRNAFETFLRSYAQLEVETLNINRSEVFFHPEKAMPSVIILEADFLGARLGDELNRLKLENGHVTSVVIVDTSAQARIAKEAGAKVVWIKSMLYERFDIKALIP